MKLYLAILFLLIATGLHSLSAQDERRRTVPSVPVATASLQTGFSESPTDLEFFKKGGFTLPLVPSGETSSAENLALAEALAKYRENRLDYDFTPIDAFLSVYPESSWKIGLLANKGLILRYSGFLGASFPVLEEVWLLGKDSDQLAIQSYANRAMAELISIKAGLGREDELDSLFDQIEDRSFQGRSAELIANAKLGRASMRNDPDKSFNCGPAALVNVLDALGVKAAADGRIMAKAATVEGLSLDDVAKLADLIGFTDYRIGYRDVETSSYFIPSIVHWKEGHFSALIRQEGQHYLVRDPTLGNEMWIPQEALDTETSGYFLITQNELPSGWRNVDSEEAGTVWGKGKTTLTEDGATRPYDLKSCDNSQSRGMPQYAVHMLLASLNISDTPIWVNTPFGSPVAFTVTYNQREIGLPDPSMAVAGTMGANWTHNWQSWTDSEGTFISGVGPQTVKITVPGGGVETFHLNSAQTAYQIQRDTQSILSATFDAGSSHPLDQTGFILTFPNGSKLTYGLLQDVGADRFFLTDMIDPYGNEIVLNYDADYRLTTVVSDALSSPALTFVYEYDSGGSPVLPASAASEAEDYFIKEVIGPMGRYASFDYDHSFRLDRIADMAGLESQFDYSVSYLSRMITPYGQTLFVYPEDGGVSRAIEITDPEGQKERIEFTREVDVATLWSAETAPSGTAKGLHFTDDLNTFHWDKRAMMTAVNPDGSLDYSQATLYHWMLADSQRASSVVHSIKRPLENRDWFVYPDTFNDDLVTIGETATPIAIKRFVKNETGATVERMSQLEYNSLGQVARFIDPHGREWEADYAPNGIDLASLTQRVGPGPADYETLVSLDYDEDDNGIDDFPHLPSVIEWADGIRLDLTYNSKGQILSATRFRPDGQGGFASEGTTDFTYDTTGTGETYGFLASVQGPDLAGNRSTTVYTFDAYGRVKTATDNDDFVLTYSYDDLDRIIQVDYPDETYVAKIFEPFSEGLDLIGFRDRLGRISQFAHDDLGRIVHSIDPKGQSSFYDWCSCGSLQALTDPSGNTTTWMTDVQGRVTDKIYPDLSSISYLYEPESGQLSRITDQRGYRREFRYFADGSLQQISFDDGGTGDPGFIDSPTVTYTYDPYHNRLVTATTADDPDDYSFAYYGFTGDASANRLQTMTISKVRDGQTVNANVDYSYDSLGRLSTRTFKGQTEAFGYDDLGRLETLSDPLGDFTFAYDGLTARIAALDHTVSGVEGLRTDLVYEHKLTGGQERKIPYLSSISHSNPSETLALHSFVRDEDGRIEQWSRYDGTQWLTSTYRYDQISQLETARKYAGLDPVGVPLERRENRYDPAGNRILGADDSDQLNVSYNDLNQFVSRSGEGGVLFHGSISEPGLVLVQELDGSNNVVESKEAQLYGGNEFYAQLDLPVGTNTVRIQATDIHGETSLQDYSVPVAADSGDDFTYDAAGNLTQWVKSNGTVIDYKWDVANRLRSVEVDSVLIRSFEYDGAGRMTRTTDAAGNRGDYFWDGLEQLGRESLDVTPTVYRRYLTQGFTESLDGASASSYFTLRDHLGSSRQVLDDSYAVVAEYDYSAWGEVEKLSGTVEPDHLYTGHLHLPDADTPLHLAPYRAYQPELGRWLSRDFIGETGPDGSNIYRYSRNNPINETDPTGLISSLHTPSGHALMAYMALEAASTAYDATVAATVITNSCSTISDVAPALGALLFGIISPGPGTAYTQAGAGLHDGYRVVVANKGVQANRIAGQVGEDFLKNTYGGAQQVFRRTSSGGRYIDNLVDGIAMESKVGRTSLSSRVRSQIAKDVELMNTPGSGVTSIQWHFFPSKTGVGPTAPLQKALEDAGIVIFTY